MSGKQAPKAPALPIDINLGRLEEWMINREWVRKDYFDALKVIRQKVRTAWEATPESIRASTNVGDPEEINSFTANAIFDHLTASKEHGDKNLLGQFTSELTKQWADITSAYKKNNVYLVDAAKMLTHDVTFEIPALKKAIARSTKRIQDIDNKEIEYNAQIGRHKQTFKAECEKLGFEASSAIGLEEKIAGIQTQLEPLFEGIVTKLRSPKVQEAVQYYKEFVAYTTGLPAEKRQPLLPTLQYLVEKGNTSVHTFHTGEDVPVNNHVGTSGDDFGASQGAATTGIGNDAPAIDFGDEPAIDFGDEPAIDFGDEPIIDLSDAPTIDFGDLDGGDVAIVTEESGEAVIAESLLHNDDLRNTITDELEELSSFFAARVEDMAYATSITSLNMFTDASPVVEKQTKESVQVMATAVEEILATLQDKHTETLLLIRSSQPFTDRLADGLTRNLELADRTTKRLLDLKQQRKESQETIAASKAKMTAFRKKIRSLQKSLEKAISKLYDGRRVNIIGEINEV